MKANELMVDDWVKIKTYGISDKFERTEAYIYVKVAEIGSGLNIDKAALVSQVLFFVVFRLNNPH